MNIKNKNATMRLWSMILLLEGMFQDSCSFYSKNSTFPTRKISEELLSVEEEEEFLNPFQISTKEYDALSSESKQSMWWDLIKKTEGTTITSSGSPVTDLSDADLACDVTRDYRPFHTDRAIHKEGAVAKIEFTISENSYSSSSSSSHYYSGIFESGSTNGLIRMSGALGITTGFFVPTTALKFFRDGVTSGNLIFGSEIPLIANYNFFTHDQLSHFHHVGMLGASRFATVDFPFHMVGSADVAMYNQYGNLTETDELKFPFEIIMKPTAEVQEIFGVASSREEYMESMERVPVNTTIYEVYGRDHSEDSFQDLVKIGSIQIKSKIVFSANADQYLFFQHNRMSTDMELGDKSWSVFCPLAKMNIFA